MKTFKRYSAALAAAGDQDIINIQIGTENLYIVPGDGYHEAIETIQVLTQEPSKYSVSGVQRAVAGQITPRHLKRLGNANHALTKAEVVEASLGKANA